MKIVASLRDLANKEPLLSLVVLGILTRIVVFAFLSPFNNDSGGHYEHIRIIVAEHRIPITGENQQSYHPPLYFLLASLFWFDGDAKAIQGFSLLLSVGTLLLAYQFIARSGVVRDARARWYSLALVAFLPQFILFGLFLSNDALAVFLGFAVCVQFASFAGQPSWRQLMGLAALVGLGLLTKTTFLVHVPVVAAGVFLCSRAAKLPFLRACGGAAVFVLVATAIGSFKYVQNHLAHGSAFVNNLDYEYDWVLEQRGTYTGISSLLDVNVLTLVRYPAISEHTKHSFPLLLYGSFWYQHDLMSDFIGSSRVPTKYLGSVIYLVAVVPTAVMWMGVFALGGSCHRALRSDAGEAGARDLAVGATLAALFLGNVALLLVVELKYDVWSVLQGRLLFPTMPGALVLFAAGVEVCQERTWPRRVLDVAMKALFALFFVYFSTEIFFKVVRETSPELKEWLKSVFKISL